MRGAAKNTDDLHVKTELVAAATLARTLSGNTSISDFGKRFNMSPPAQQAIAAAVRDPSLLTESFQFDPVEFARQVPYRSVELDTGVMLTADSVDFDKYVHREVVNRADDKVRFSTEGKVMSEKLAKSR